jgi:hypothetical protein
MLDELPRVGVALNAVSRDRRNLALSWFRIAGNGNDSATQRKVV